MEDVYLKYYINQAGSGVGNFYSGPIYQRGYGVGSFLGGLFRSVLPILKKGSMALGRKLTSCGSNVISGMEQNVPVQSAVRKHGTQTLNNLKRKVLDKIAGNGYNGAKRVKVRQSKASSRTVQSKKKSNPKKTKSKKNNSKSKPKRTSKKTKLLSDIFR